MVVGDTSPIWLSSAEYAANLGDRTASDEISPLGAWPIVFVRLEQEWRPATVPARRDGVAVGVTDRVVEAGAGDDFDILLCSDPNAPRPFVYVPGDRIDQTTAVLAETVAQFPLASTLLAQLLRTGEGVTFEAAIFLESLGYSTLLGGPEFARWRNANPARKESEKEGLFVRSEVRDESIIITLARKHVHNAFNTAMRDQLADALQDALVRADRPRIVLCGEGPSFCSGGDVDEFGTAPDPATAHIVRLRRSAALLVHSAASRITALLHGACIGAGIEIPAAASFLTARPDTRFRLPEVQMGLIPGAGGTATLPRRIGRHRTCFMALSATNVDARTALNWGLVDVVEALR